MAAPSTTGVMRTNLADMQIGDYIPCSYYQPNSGSPGSFYGLGINEGTEIPMTSSSNPSGLFYFIKTDKGICVADRNVQHTIKWDILNSYYFTEGRSLKDTLQKTPFTATTPTGTGQCAVFSPDGAYCAVGHASTPFITIYKITDGIFTKLGNPAALPGGQVNGIKFSSDGTYMACSHNGIPYITIYKRDGDTFTKLDNPDTLPASNCNDVSFTTDNTYLAVAGATSPFLMIYKRSGDVFTKLSDPTTQPSGAAAALAFSPDGVHLAVGAGSSVPLAVVYKRTDDTFSKLPDLTSLPTSTVKGVAFSPDGTHMVLASGTTPNLHVYKRESDTFTRLVNAIPLPAADTMYDISFSPDGNYLVGACYGNPYIYLFKRTSADVYTKMDLTTPLSSLSGYGYGAAISPDGSTVVGTGATSPYIGVFKVFKDAAAVRVLGGGNSYIDANGNSSAVDNSLGSWPRYNEWDKYIVGSDLLGKIIAGDDNVWHWSNLYSWVQDQPTYAINASPSYKCYRGKDSVIKLGSATSASAGTTYGFRPVLEYLETDAKASCLWY